MARWFRAFILACVLVAACGAFADASAAFRITYLTSTTAYIDAGSADGLAVGDRVEVVRAGAVIATLRVADVSAHRAACAIESPTAALAVGDGVRFTLGAHAAVGDSSATASTLYAAPLPTDEDALTNGEPWPRSIGVRGRIGVRYLGVIDQSGFGGDVSQPSADIRLDGTRIARSSFDAQVDVRARHTVQTVADGRQFNDGEARVYRFNTTWRSQHDGMHVTAGRQFASALASVSTFDGLEVEFDSKRVGAGAFAGTQPAPIDYRFSTDIQEYGAFLRGRSSPGAGVHWETVVAGIGSYENGKINREYVALLGNVGTKRTSLMLQQEIDINRGWKQNAGEPSSSPTSTFIAARYRVVDGVNVDAGYDNRREVRLYRDYVSPETEFDDSYRQGVWGGGSVGFAQRFRVGAAARSSSGGSAGDAMSYTLTAGAERVTPAHLQFRLRSTRYDNERSDGWMHSLSAGLAVGPRWMFEFYGGVRDSNGKTLATPDVSSSWFGADLDVGLAESWYLSLSGERNASGDEGYDQVYTSLSWRF